MCEASISQLTTISRNSSGLAASGVMSLVANIKMRMSHVDLVMAVMSAHPSGPNKGKTRFIKHPFHTLSGYIP